MIKSRFFIHLAFFIGALAVVIPLAVQVTLPAFVANAPYTNQTCTVIERNNQVSPSDATLFRLNMILRCNTTGTPFNATTYDTSAGTYTAGDKTTALTPEYNLGASVRAFYIPPFVGTVVLALDYAGWAIVLELLAGVIGVISLVGMIISLIFNEDNVEPL